MGGLNAGECKSCGHKTRKCLPSRENVPVLGGHSGDESLLGIDDSGPEQENGYSRSRCERMCSLGIKVLSIETSTVTLVRVPTSLPDNFTRCGG